MRISDWSSDVCSSDLLAVRQTPFPEPAVETAYPTRLAARHAIVDQLRRPLGPLPEADRAFIDALLGETLDQTIIADRIRERRSEEHTSELPSPMRISYAVFCLKQNKCSYTYRTPSYTK